MVVLKSKLKASTLIEVIIGMVIIMIVFGLAMMTFGNIHTSGNTGLQIYAGMHIDRIYEETLMEESFFDEDYKVESIKIEKKVTPYKNSDNLIIVELTAFDNKGKALISKRELIKSEIKHGY